MNTNRNTPDKLFHNLMKLSENNEAFYFSDQDITINEKKYIIRSFSYRLASYTDFTDNLHLSARESRGTAFYTEKGKENWELFCRAYPKFWNLGEGIEQKTFINEHNPYTSFEKMDGSLMLFGKISDKIIAKSKTSINSDQAQMAQKIYDANKTIQKTVEYLIEHDYTPVFELVGPDNVVVLRYSKNELVLLGYVENETGKVVPAGEFERNKFGIKTPKVYKHTWDELLDIKENSTDNIEGFVVLTDKSEFVKVKTQFYVNKHHLKDNINNIKSLTELILDDNIDDLISEFQGDQETIDYIIEMQTKIGHKFNHLVATVEKWVEENKGLNRKEFAIKTKNEFSEFSLAMNLYLGKSPDYKEFFMKNKMYNE